MMTVNTMNFHVSTLTRNKRGRCYMTNLLNEIGDMVQTILNHNGFLDLHSFALSLSLGPLKQPLLLGCSVLRPVLQQHLEQI
jgi:hypothetical protein